MQSVLAAGDAEYLLIFGYRRVLGAVAAHATVRVVGIAKERGRVIAGNSLG